MSNFYLCDMCEGKSFDWSQHEVFCNKKDEPVEKVMFIDKGHQSRPMDYCEDYIQEKL